MSDQYEEKVKGIVLTELAAYRVRVYLFGSRAVGRAVGTSDIDVAVEPLEALPVGLLSNIREQLEDSDVPYQVDLVDLSLATKELLRTVKREGVLWKDCSLD